MGSRPGARLARHARRRDARRSRLAASGRDRYRDWRETGGDPYRDRHYGQTGSDSSGIRVGEIDDRPVRYGRGIDWDQDWRRSSQAAGQYTGRGPRGYQRSDERIREDVSEILWQDGAIDASQLDVTVEHGEVTLEGTVDSRWTKRMVEDAAYAARGVHDVHNRIRVRRLQPGSWDRDIDTTTQANASEMSVVPDMTVVAAGGDEVGIVKEVRDDTILVDRPMARDIYIPRSAVNISGGAAHLDIRAGDVDNQGWQNPPMTGTETDYDERVELT